MAQDIWECCECGVVFYSKKRREPPLCYFCLHYPGWNLSKDWWFLRWGEEPSLNPPNEPWEDE